MSEHIKHATIETLPPVTDRLFLTIAVPTLNRLSYLRKTLESVFNQTCDDFEILVSNNGSSDGTKEYLDSLIAPRLALFHQETTLSMVDNWNFLLERSKGTYFLLLSDDDLIDECFVANCMKSLKNYQHLGKEISLIYGSAAIINLSGQVMERMKNNVTEPLESGNEFVVNWFRRLRPAYLCATLFETLALRKIGGFNESNKFAADSVARSLLSLNKQVLYVKDAVAYYRVHNDNATVNSFNFVNKLHCNIDIIEKVVSAIDATNDDYIKKVKKAGIYYSKGSLIFDSALENKEDFKFNKFKEFSSAYARQFGVFDFLSYGLIKYIRHVLF